MRPLTILLTLFGVTFLANPVRAANLFWISAASSSWNNAANWAAASGGASGAGIPGAADNVTFDNNGLGNCSIPAAVTVSSLTIKPGYTGTITQGAAAPITVSVAAVFTGGTFVGSASNITFNGTVTISGTTFTFPAQVNMNGGNWTYTSGALNTNANFSNVTFSSTVTITGSVTLFNVTFNNPGPFTNTYTIAGTTVTVSGALFMSGNSGIILTGGTIDLMGNFSLSNTSGLGGGTTTLVFLGPGNQVISSVLPAFENNLPSISINKPSGTLVLPPVLTVTGNSWVYSAGTLDVTTNNSTVVFAPNNSFSIVGTQTLNNVNFDDGNGFGITFTIPSTLTISDTMTMSGPGAITMSGGTIDLLGNVNLTNTSSLGGGTTMLDFTGAGNQAIFSSLPVNENFLPSVTINKPSGTLTFPPNLSVAGSTWTYTVGTLDPTANNSTVFFSPGGVFTITGSHTLNSVNFNNTSGFGATFAVAAGTTFTVADTLTLSGVNIETYTGTIDLLGDLNLSNTAIGDGGSAIFNFIGTGNQAILSTLPVNQSAIPSVTINKPSGTLTFPSILTFAGNTWTYAAGTVDAASNASTVYFTNNDVINSNGMSFYNFCVSGGRSTLGNSLSVINNLSITPSPANLRPGGNTINLSGNWADWGAGGFTAAASTVNFLGSALQTITNPAGETFTNLTVNNTGPGIRLVNNVTASGTLNMTLGNIDLNSNTLTIGTSTANPGTLIYTSGTAINTGSITRWFKAGTIAIGSVTGLFPTGTAPNYRPFNVSAPAAGIGTGGTITVTYTDGGATAPVLIPDGTFTVVVQKTPLNWAIATGNGLAGGTYNLEISGTGYGVIGAVSDLRLTLVNSAVGIAGVNAGTTANPQVNRINLTAANLNNSFYLGSINAGATPLPITLINFSASASGSAVQLDWTATLIGDNSVFTVQRSKDGNAWDSLIRVDGNGSGTTSTYTAFDHSPPAGVNYYRLKIADQDGAVSYSPTAVVDISAGANTLRIYPNPVAGLLTITGSRPGSYSVTLLSETGRLLISARGESLSPIQLNVSELAAGIYFVLTIGNGWSDIRKITIIH